MTIQTAIQKAIEGGYEMFGKSKQPLFSFELGLISRAITDKRMTIFAKWGVKNGQDIVLQQTEIYLEEVLLDPEFWKCLGKSMGWEKKSWFGYGEKETKRLLKKRALIPRWQYHWHELIDYLAQGKSIEDYFNQL